MYSPPLPAGITLYVIGGAATVGVFGEADPKRPLAALARPMRPCRLDAPGCCARIAAVAGDDVARRMSATPSAAPPTISTVLTVPLTGRPSCDTSRDWD